MKKRSPMLDKIFRRTVVALAVFCLFYSAYALYRHSPLNTHIIDDSCRPMPGAYIAGGRKIPVVQDIRVGSGPTLLLSSWLLLGLSAFVIAHYLAAKKSSRR